MKRLCIYSMVLLLVAFFSGCEWTSSGGSGGWSDRYSWVNFSGLYRGSGGALVSEFAAEESAATTTTTTTPTTTTTDGNTTITTTVVNGESAGTAPAFQTSLNGGLNFRPGIVPGSVTFVLNATTANGSSGSVTDNGSGGLTGFVNLVGPDPTTAQPVTGTINYDTGVWAMDLTSPGLLSSAAMFVSYSYNTEIASDGGGSGGSSDSDDDTDSGSTALGIAGGDIYSVQVEQTGNQLTFRLSNGYTLTGQLSVVSLPGGDQTGRSAGDVSATYEVSGNIEGSSVKVNGTLSGVYVPPADIEFANDDAPVLFGILSSRILQGIWMQPGGTADIYGIAPQQSVPVNVGDFDDPVDNNEEAQ